MSLTNDERSRARLMKRFFADSDALIDMLEGVYDVLNLDTFEVNEGYWVFPFLSHCDVGVSIRTDEPRENFDWAQCLGEIAMRDSDWRLESDHSARTGFFSFAHTGGFLPTLRVSISLLPLSTPSAANPTEAAGPMADKRGSNEAAGENPAKRSKADEQTAQKSTKITAFGQQPAIASDVARNASCDPNSDNCSDEEDSLQRYEFRSDLQKFDNSFMTSMIDRCTPLKIGDNEVKAHDLRYLVNFEEVPNTVMHAYLALVQASERKEGPVFRIIDPRYVCLYQSFGHDEDYVRKYVQRHAIDHGDAEREDHTHLDLAILPIRRTDETWDVLAIRFKDRRMEFFTPDFNWTAAFDAFKLGRAYVASKIEDYMEQQEYLKVWEHRVAQKFPCSSSRRYLDKAIIAAQTIKELSRSKKSLVQNSRKAWRFAQKKDQDLCDQMCKELLMQKLAPL